MGLFMILLYLTPVAYLLYLYINRKYSYWAERGVKAPPFPENFFPLGNLLVQFRKDSIQFELDNTKRFGKVYGRYVGVQPTLNISDIELVKQVMIKDFHLFVNRRKFNVIDKHWKTNLFFSQDETWKRIRSIVTPAFTSGKLRRMYPLLKEATNKLEKYLDSITKEPDNSVNIKDVIAGFTIDVIASTAFGTDTDANGDRSKFNPFLHHGQRLFQKLSIPRLFFLIIAPLPIIKLFNVRHAFIHDSFDFIVNVVKTMIKRGGKRDDLIALLKEANIAEDEYKNLDKNLQNLAANDETENPVAFSENQEKKTTKLMKTLTDEEIVGQCIVFFIAGFETTSSTITSTIFQLVQNPDIQERVYAEVCEKLADLDPEENLEEFYETIINRMPYLESVIKETLRMVPPVTRLERRFDGETGYKLGNVTLEKGMLVEISTVSVHFDEDYYPDPFTYNPDRFLPENKDKLASKDAYLPFGTGPRNCAGLRFAYQELKVALASLIRKYQFVKNDKTPDTMEFVDKKVGLLIPKPFDITIHQR